MDVVIMDFSEALKLIKEGHLVARSGWNVKGMYLFIVEVSPIHINNQRLDGTSYLVLVGGLEPFICIKTAQGTYLPWTCSQADIMADDWEAVE